MRLFILALHIFLIPKAFAIELSERTTAGSSLFEQALGVNGEIGGDDENDIDAPWIWNLDYDFSRSTSTAEGEAPVTDNTQEYSAGGGYHAESGLALDLDLQYANTPEEQLTSRGGALNPSFRWEYDRSAQTKESFSPFLQFKLDAGTTNYLESFSGTVKRRKAVVRPVSGRSEIRQNLIGFNLAWRPVHALRFSFTMDHSSYNKDVAKFQAALDSAAALRRGIGAFSSTVGGLPRVEYIGSVTWYIARGWKNIVSEVYSIAAADDSVSTTTKEMLEHTIHGDWRVSAGVKFEKSSGESDTLGIIGLSWDSD